MTTKGRCGLSFLTMASEQLPECFMDMQPIDATNESHLYNFYYPKASYFNPYYAKNHIYLNGPSNLMYLHRVQRPVTSPAVAFVRQSPRTFDDHHSPFFFPFSTRLFCFSSAYNYFHSCHGFWKKMLDIFMVGIHFRNKNVKRYL